MMVEELGGAERKALLLLALAGGRAVASELKVQFGIDLKKPARDGLVGSGLVTARKTRSFELTLTDAGWTYLDEDIAANPPGGDKVWFLLLEKMADRGIGLGTLLRDTPEPKPAEAEPEGTDARIAAAYEKLARPAGEWVELRLLRETLGDIDREDLDQALRQMRRDKRLTMTLKDNQSRLTDADRAAALKIGADDMHYIRMEPA